MEAPMFTVWTDLIYLSICVTISLWVGRTLYKNGRIFLVEVFTGREDLADSVNHLLVVGFYLIAIGFVTIGVRIGAGPNEMADAVEIVSSKVGVVLLVLGAMHFLNLFAFSRLRWRIRLAGPQERPIVDDGPGPFPRMGPYPKPGDTEENLPGDGEAYPREQ
jgi:hypothetical protein